MVDERAVTVCVRVRPLIARENADLHDEGISWKSEGCTISQIDGSRSFTFDQVFHSTDGTPEVYKRVAAPIISSAVQGYNGTIFAYGQTASGKTYTMLGNKDCPGILPLSIEDVFKTICRIPDREFLLRISYMEIHNETIQDLLCSNIRKKKPLAVREDINRSIYVEDLSEEVVVSPEQVMNWLRKGEKNRHYGETKMNERSSRSHTIFRMIIESKEKTDTSSSNYDGAVMVSHLNLVDLAGSERTSLTGAEGIRLKEGCNINRSLFILGQVINKLSDEQSGGYISYRASKLTRILQNSLGGNAKTVIICTVTPVSLEETLSTLQFASTAKKMKNKPKLNEVLDDDALLKRYRREIEELRQLLKEVSSHSHTREVEKDQLAQLLEEKNLLQKRQQDRIRSLTEMLVTASSFSLERELKARKKRRVTWAPGEMNQEGGICFLDDIPARSKKFKPSVNSLPEMDETTWSEFSDGEDQGTIPEEWVPSSEITFSQKDFADSVQLCEMLAEEKDAAVNEQHATKKKLESALQKNEELACELEELKERISTEEFVALEKEATKEQEEETKAKDMLLKEQEHKMDALKKEVTELKNLVEELRKENGRRDTSFSMDTSSTAANEMQQLKQSLSDAEAVAMDAKRESSFLRSENQSLKEKLDQLSGEHSQMGKDAECYQKQLEDGKKTYKKMLSDMQMELQYYVQENAKLTLLLDGKVPKDLLSCVELEEKLKVVKNELNKALEENVVLKEEMTALSEVDHEKLQKEILEKSEEIASLTSERETLLSQVSENERMLQEMAEVLKSKEDISKTEAMRQNDTTLQEATRQFDELEKRFSVVLEENQQKKGQVASLSEENLKLNTTLSDIAQELSSKDKELQEKNLEEEKLNEQLHQAYQKLSDMEKLSDQVKALESKAEAAEMEKVALAQRLNDGEEQIRVLMEERDSLQQEREALEHERDQIKEDIQETVSMNIETQEELRNAHDSLKQSQKRIQELEQTVLEKESQISSANETFKLTIDEQKQQILKLTEDLEQVNLEKNLFLKGEAQETVPEENSEFQLLKEQILCLTQEKEVLQQQLEGLQVEKDQCLEKLQLLATQVQEIQVMNTEEGEAGMKEELCQSLDQLSEMEQIREQLKAAESRMEVEKRDKELLTQKLLENEETMKALVQERDELRHDRAALQTERDQIEEERLSVQSMLSLKMQELQEAEQAESQRMKEQLCQDEQKLIIQQLEAQLADLKQLLEKREEQIQQDAERMSEMEQLQITSESQMQAVEREKELLLEKLNTAKDSPPATWEQEDLKTRVEVLQSERDHMIQTIHRLSETVEKTVAANLELQGQLRDATSALGEQNKIVEELKGEMVNKNSQASKVQETLDQLTQKVEILTEELNLKTGENNSLLTEKEQQMASMQVLEEEKSLLQKEKADLQQAVESIRAEKDQLQKSLSENVEKFSETKAELEHALADMRTQLNQATQEKSPENREQEHMKCLDSKVLKIMESLEKFLMLEKKSEYLKVVSLNIKSDLNRQKAIVAKGVADLSREQSKNIKGLQMEHEYLCNSLHSLLNKFQYLFSRKCKKNRECYANISKFTEELLAEKRKQYELLTQIRHLEKSGLEQLGALSEQLNLLQQNQNLDFYIEQILKDVTESEEEFLSIEGKVKEMEKGSQEANRYLERCLVHFDVQDTEAGIKQHNEVLRPLGRLLTSQAQVLCDARQELETRNNNYCKEAKDALKTCRERNKDLLQELNALKEQQTPCGAANLALEEENYSLGNKLKAAEQHIKDLKLKMQELENVANKARAHLQEKEKRIESLEMAIQIRASKSEVVQLKAALEEKEACLRSALAEKQTLQIRLDKGAELYKGEIEDLKTELAKADMARTKQSKYFEREIANLRAIVEHREDQLRQLREELRRVQQDQDVTVMSSGKDLCQPSLPITCGGGSGIVQSTQVLVLKSEHAKLEKEYGQLQKQNEILQKNELLLKEEVKKWKERALKKREQLAKDSNEEHRLKTPRKTAPPSFTEVPPSPSKRCSSQSTDAHPLLPMDCPTNFFDSPKLMDTKPAGAESIENNEWIEARNKGDAAKCKTQ